MTSALFLPVDPCSQGVADLSSRRGCATLAGMAKQAPLPKQRHYRNPARKSSGASSRPSRVAESMGFKGEFRQWDQRLIDLHNSDPNLSDGSKRHHTERPNGESCLI